MLLGTYGNKTLVASGPPARVYGPTQRRRLCLHEILTTSQRLRTKSYADIKFISTTLYNFYVQSSTLIRLSIEVQMIRSIEILKINTGFNLYFDNFKR